MDREKEFKKFDEMYGVEEVGGDPERPHKIDGIPFMDAPNQYDLLAIYYAIFSNSMVVIQIAKILNERHIKNCGSEYALFKIVGNPVQGFDMIHRHAVNEDELRPDTDPLTFLHWYADRKFRELEKITLLAERHVTPMKYIEFRPKQNKKKKVEIFAQAMKDMGLGDVEAVERPAGDIL